MGPEDEVPAVSSQEAARLRKIDRSLLKGLLLDVEQEIKATYAEHGLHLFA